MQFESSAFMHVESRDQPGLHSEALSPTHETHSKRRPTSWKLSSISAGPQCACMHMYTHNDLKKWSFMTELMDTNIYFYIDFSSSMLLNSSLVQFSGFSMQIAMPSPGTEHILKRAAPDCTGSTASSAALIRSRERHPGSELTGKQPAFHDKCGAFFLLGLHNVLCQAHKLTRIACWEHCFSSERRAWCRVLCICQ